MVAMTHPRPVARPSRPRPRPVRPAAAAPAAPKNVALGYVAQEGQASRVLADPYAPELEREVGQIGAVAAPGVALVAAHRTLAEARGYSPEDLEAVAEIGYHYLMSGGLRLALVLFEGLQAVSPGEPYFAMALGLTHDKLGNVVEARRWYERASELDPGDPRPDINRAEFLLEAGDLREAAELLGTAREKAMAHGDSELARKSGALLAHIGSRKALSPPRRCVGAA